MPHSEDHAAVSHSIVLCEWPADWTSAADLFARAGIAPPHRYFDPEIAAPRLRSWDVANLDDYVAALHQHHCPPGHTFAVALRWCDLRRLHRQVAGLRQMTSQRLADIVEFIAPRPTYIWMRQTSARNRAQTGATNASTPVDRRAQRLRTATDAVWEQWFRAIGVQPIEITDRQMGDDPSAVVALLTATARRAAAEADAAA